MKRKFINFINVHKTFIDNIQTVVNNLVLLSCLNSSYIFQCNNYLDQISGVTNPSFSFALGTDMIVSNGISISFKRLEISFISFVSTDI